jgi:peptidoglycan/LPS O-acetylase OafA/YrhL
MPPLLLPQTLGDAIATALYVPNYVFAAQGTDYLTVAAPSLFQHYWSLGVPRFRLGLADFPVEGCRWWRPQ